MESILMDFPINYFLFNLMEFQNSLLFNIIYINLFIFYFLNLIFNDLNSLIYLYQKMNFIIIM